MLCPFCHEEKDLIQSNELHYTVDRKGNLGYYFYYECPVCGYILSGYYPDYVKELRAITLANLDTLPKLVKPGSK